MSAGNWKELYQAATEGNLDLVKYQIKEGANPNYQHPEILATPLVAAITNGHTEVALYLLDNGADPTLESYFDNLTPLKAAKKNKNKELISALKKLL
jgi:uncharacterized protein